jgi:hypothetical protein
MEETILKCDCCGKQSSDTCGDVGWIKIEASCQSSFCIGISNGRTLDNCHKSKFWKGSLEKLDFCSIGCMLKWMGIEKEIEKEHDRNKTIFNVVELFDEEINEEKIQEDRVVMKFTEILGNTKSAFDRYIVEVIGIGRKEIK